MSEQLAIVVGILTTLTLCTTLIGLATRFVLLPWLREHISGPVKETQRQVSVNRRTSVPPTLLDKLDSVAQDVARVREDVRTAAEMFEGHIGLSAQDRRELWAAIKQLRKDNQS